MAILTREQMEQVIDEGGSVGYKGRIITTKEGLPTAADLAKGDPEKEAAAQADLQAQIAALQAQVAKLQGGTGEQSPAGDTTQIPATEPAPAGETIVSDTAGADLDTKKGKAKE